MILKYIKLQENSSFRCLIDKRTFKDFSSTKTKILFKGKTYLDLYDVKGVQEHNAQSHKFQKYLILNIIVFFVFDKMPALLRMRIEGWNN